MLNKLSFVVFSALLMQSCLLFSAGPSTSSSIQWQTNYEAAMKQAKASSKPLLLFFTGSDWCTWCNKLDEEALETAAFAQAAGEKFIFVKLDFPLYTNQDPQTKAQNKQLQQKYNVRSFPTVVVWDPQQNQQIGTSGYRSGGGKPYADYLIKMVNDYSSYKQKMGALDKAKFSGTSLKQLYEKACELRLENDANKIVKLGIESDESLFFLTERYRFLATEGQIHTLEATALRQQLLAADPDNAKRIPYKVAVIEFETYCEEMEKENYGPELAIAPLVAYMEKYGMHDKDNVWRLHMIVSQVYLDKNQMTNALKYAQASYETAPATAQPELARAVQNIRSQINPTLGFAPF